MRQWDKLFSSWLSLQLARDINGIALFRLNLFSLKRIESKLISVHVEIMISIK